MHTQVSPTLIRDGRRSGSPALLQLQRRRCRVLATAAFAAIGMVAAQEGDSVKAKLEDQALGLIISVSPVELQLDDSVTVRVAVLNSGRRPAYLYNQIGYGASSGIVLEVRDMEDRPARSSFYPRDPPPPPPSLRAQDVTVLRGGDFLGTQTVEPARHFVPGPGEYKIRARYRVIGSSPSAQGATSFEGPMITSEWIQVRVLQ